MRKILVNTLLIAVVIASALTACVRDNFRYYGYEDQLEGYFPVDSIEKGHTWTLTNNCTSFVRGDVDGAAKVCILSGDPFTSTGVEILAEASTNSRVSKQLNYMVPSAQSKIFAVVLDDDGKYLRIAQASTNQETITLGTTEPTGTPNTVSRQRIFYCFEADYPNPGDWDYNDVVMSITKEPTDNEEVVALKVRLDAVGYLSQIAAAIRLVGYSYESVDITQDEASTFVREPDRERLFIKQSDLKLKALNGNAVINLFDDAHLAMFHLAADGSVYRRYFNTIQNPTSSNNGAVQPPVLVTYYINFHDAYQARNFTLAEIDPFIVVQYGQTGDNFWEVHTYPYKLSEVLFNYYNGAATSYNNGFSWALAVPYGKFRYPLEEQAIGERKNTIVAGAYQESGHSWGEWILDHAKAQDWYLYPAAGAVY